MTDITNTFKEHAVQGTISHPDKAMQLFLQYNYSPNVNNQYGNTINELSQRTLPSQRIYQELNQDHISIFRQIEEHDDQEYEQPLGTAKYFFLTREEEQTFGQHLEEAARIR